MHLLTGSSDQSNSSLSEKRTTNYPYLALCVRQLTVALGRTYAVRSGGRRKPLLIRAGVLWICFVLSKVNYWISKKFLVGCAVHFRFEAGVV